MSASTRHHGRLSLGAANPAEANGSADHQANADVLAEAPHGDFDYTKLWILSPDIPRGPDTSIAVWPREARS